VTKPDPNSEIIMVRMVVSLEVNKRSWSEEFGIDPRSDIVRHDVKSYVRTLLQDHGPSQDELWTVKSVT